MGLTSRSGHSSVAQNCRLRLRICQNWSARRKESVSDRDCAQKSYNNWPKIVIVKGEDTPKIRIPTIKEKYGKHNGFQCFKQNLKMSLKTLKNTLSSSLLLNFGDPNFWCMFPFEIWTSGEGEGRRGDHDVHQRKGPDDDDLSGRRPMAWSVWRISLFVYRKS